MQQSCILIGDMLKLGTADSERQQTEAAARLRSLGYRVCCDHEMSDLFDLRGRSQCSLRMHMAFAREADIGVLMSGWHRSQASCAFVILLASLGCRLYEYDPQGIKALPRSRMPKLISSV